MNANLSTRNYLAILAVLTLLVGSCSGDGDAADSEAPADPVPTSAVTTTAMATTTSTTTAPAPVAAVTVTCDPAGSAMFVAAELPQPDYSDEDLRCADFTGTSLAQPNFAGTNLSGAGFQDADLAQPNFDRTTLVGADFNGATISQGRFVDADLRGAEMRNAELVSVAYVNSICPDGRNSDDVGGTCDGALEPMNVGVEYAEALDDPVAAPPEDPVAESARSACAGYYLGTYSGDDEGPFAARIDEAGNLYSAFVFADILDIDIDELLVSGLEIGRDVILDADGVSFAPGVLRIDTEGVKLGSIVLPLERIGEVDELGKVKAIAQTGALVQGEFDLQTCTGSGVWVNFGLQGTWQVGLGADTFDLGDGDCAGSLFVGVDRSTGNVAVDLDGACLARATATLPVIQLDEVASSDVEVRQGDGYTAYTVGGEVLFAFGSRELTSDAEDVIGEIAASILLRAVEPVAISVIGHTDSIGSSQSNLDLSFARADAAAALFDQLLIDIDVDIQSVGLGESQPIAPNVNPDGTDNPDGRRQNRRVVIIVSGG